MEQRGYIGLRLDELRKKILNMAAHTEKALEKAFKGFFENNAELAEQVIDGDDVINELECALDKYSLELLALNQPMARDLRLIVGCMRITSNLERIADEAVNIAQRTVFLSTRPLLPIDPRMETLAGIVRNMFIQAVSSFVRSDTEMANAVCVKDSEADQLNYDVLKKMIGDMIEESRIVERGVSHIMAARHLERIGDLSTNIAESVVFIIKGEDIKHRCRG